MKLEPQKLTFLSETGAFVASLQSSLWFLGPPPATPRRSSREQSYPQIQNALITIISWEPSIHEGLLLFRTRKMGEAVTRKTPEL